MNVKNIHATGKVVFVLSVNGKGYYETKEATIFSSIFISTNANGYIENKIEYMVTDGSIKKIDHMFIFENIAEATIFENLLNGNLAIGSEISTKSGKSKIDMIFRQSSTYLENPEVAYRLQGGEYIGAMVSFLIDRKYNNLISE